LRRVKNIQSRPDVALIVDYYDEDWSRLVWVLVRGQAELIEPGNSDHAAAVRALRAKYPQHESMQIEALPAIIIRDLVLRGWTGQDTDLGVPRRASGEEFAALVRGRRSVRAFQAKPVPRGAIEDAIAAAGWAPSPHGRQPWRFAVVESLRRREELAEAMAETWREQLRLDGQSAEIVEARLEKSRNRLVTAPVLIIPCLFLDDLDVYPDAARQEAEETMAIQSLGAAVQNLLLSIYGAGLDAGWMCAPLFCPDIVRESLGPDTSLIPHALIAVGYAAADPVRRPRLPLNDLVVQWE
jgi:F420 biosynthesis protein FbiB-like protein